MVTHSLLPLPLETHQQSEVEVLPQHCLSIMGLSTHLRCHIPPSFSGNSLTLSLWSNQFVRMQAHQVAHHHPTNNADSAAPGHTVAIMVEATTTSITGHGFEEWSRYGPFSSICIVICLFQWKQHTFKPELLIHVTKSCDLTNLPDMTCQEYQVVSASQSTQKENHQVSEGKTGANAANPDDGKKAMVGKSPSIGQELSFDNSARTLNFASSPFTGNWLLAPSFQPQILQ
ncbi:hypothetical protein GH714_036992 [Hevea brasiliensis]|uniref:Uncharacterized protein n=1 Tax=Hevea brasiliensis TaxID=3981 RepID=A0A6A6MMD6_HEVBR|nr:hypothetical protein GH714_036992 [Hevea brasiliensis]